MIHLASKTSESKLNRFTKEQIQPNAIDLRVESIHAKKKNPFTIDEDEKQHRGIAPCPMKDDYYLLDDGVYEIIMEGIITIGPDEAGYIITRSTLNRNGLFITSGLYDSGYSGVMAGALHVSGGPASIKKGTRVGQFLLFRAESIKQYDGDYGVDSDHDQEYDKGANVAAASQMVYYDRGVQMEFNLKGDLVPVEEGNLYGN